MTNRQVLQKNLKLIRYALGYSTQKLAEKSGISRQTIIEIENGTTKMTKPVYTTLCVTIAHSISDIDIYNSDPKFIEHAWFLESMLYNIFNDIINDDNREEIEAYLHGSMMLSKNKKHKIDHMNVMNILTDHKFVDIRSLPGITKPNLMVNSLLMVQSLAPDRDYRIA